MIYERGRKLQVHLALTVCKAGGCDKDAVLGKRQKRTTFGPVTSVTFRSMTGALLRMFELGAPDGGISDLAGRLCSHVG